jgi:hypothetical protein
VAVVRPSTTPYGFEAQGKSVKKRHTRGERMKILVVGATGAIGGAQA